MSNTSCMHESVVDLPEILRFQKSLIRLMTVDSDEKNPSESTARGCSKSLDDLEQAVRTDYR